MKNDPELIIKNLLIKEDLDGTIQIILEEYGSKIFHLINRTIKNTSDTEDVYQDVMIKVYKNLDSFKFESRIFTWIYTIAKRESINFQKQKLKKYDFTELNEWESNIELSYSDGLSEKKIWQLLYKCIDILPEKQQEVFMMRYFDDLSYTEISEITQSSVNTLKTNYHYAVKKLKETLQNEYERFEIK